VPPSAVANSQLHYGAATPVFIESQPDYRGTAPWDVGVQSALYFDIKLLVNQFALNDFGDTHSLVLLIDSLNVQDALTRLAPLITPAALDDIFRAATNAKASSSFGSQGKAEGDVLEKVVDALMRLFVAPQATSIEVSKQLEGGSWATIDTRSTLANALDLVAASTAFVALAGKLGIEPSTIDLRASARTGFASLATLLSLSPLVLRAQDAASQTALDTALKGVWTTTFDAWKTDSTMSVADRMAGKETFTDRWLTDRDALLRALTGRNLQDIATGAVVILGSSTTNRTFSMQSNWPWMQTFGASPIGEGAKGADTPQMKAYLTWMRELAQKGYIDPGRKIGEFRPLAAQDKVAFIWDQVLLQGVMQAANKMPDADFYQHWGVTTLPVGPGRKASSFEGGHQLVLFADGKQKKAAWTFVQYLATSPQAIRAYTLGPGSSVPPLAKVGDPELARKLDTPIYNAFARDIMPTVSTPPFGPAFAAGSTAVMAGVQQAVTGTEPIDAIAKSIQQQLPK
jgi:hypothetical protein